MSVLDHCVMDCRGLSRIARPLLAMTLLAILPVRSATAQLCSPPPPNLVSWWPAEGNAIDIIGGNSGALGVGVTFAPGLIGQAFSFNGASSVAVPSSSSLLLGAGEMTLEAWIKAPPFNGVNDVRTIVGKASVSFPFQRYDLRTRGDNRVEFTASDCGTGACGFDGEPGSGAVKQPVRSVSAVADNTWHHVAGIRRANGAREIWVDGVLENARSESMWNTDSTGPLYIGELNGVGGYFFTGLVDELQLFNRALSASEIQAIYNARGAGQCRGFLLFPNHGGNAGSVTTTMIGSGFQPGAAVKLTGSGADIGGTNTNVANASVLTTTFDLTGATPGTRTVVVTNPDNTSVSVTSAFTVQQGGAPQLLGNVVGRDKIRIGTPQSFYISYGNNGSVDALGVRLIAYVPSSLAPNLTLGNSNGVVTTVTQGSTTLITVNLGRVPAGSTSFIPVTLTAGASQGPFQIQISISGH